MVCNVYLLHIVQVTCVQLQAMFVIIRMKMRSSSGSNNNNNTTSTVEVKTLLSILLYTIVPTIWCLGSQGLRFFWRILIRHGFLFEKVFPKILRTFQKHQTFTGILTEPIFAATDLGLSFGLINLSFLPKTQSYETIFRSTYPLAHSVATLVGIGPYRRSLMEMLKQLKKRLMGGIGNVKVSIKTIMVLPVSTKLSKIWSNLWSELTKTNQIE